MLARGRRHAPYCLAKRSGAPFSECMGERGSRPKVALFPFGGLLAVFLRSHCELVPHLSNFFERELAEVGDHDASEAGNRTPERFHNLGEFFRGAVV